VAIIVRPRDQDPKYDDGNCANHIIIPTKQKNAENIIWGFKIKLMLKLMQNFSVLNLTE
jgi:hypothetical protein